MCDCEVQYILAEHLNASYFDEEFVNVIIEFATAIEISDATCVEIFDSETY